MGNGEGGHTEDAGHGADVLVLCEGRGGLARDGCRSLAAPPPLRADRGRTPGGSVTKGLPSPCGRAPLGGFDSRNEIDEGGGTEIGKPPYGNLTPTLGHRWQILSDPFCLSALQSPSERSVGPRFGGREGVGFYVGMGLKWGGGWGLIERGGACLAVIKPHGYKRPTSVPRDGSPARKNLWEKPRYMGNIVNHKCEGRCPRRLGRICRMTDERMEMRG